MDDVYKVCPIYNNNYITFYIPLGKKFMVYDDYVVKTLVD
jgi:hypothetical protein